MGGILWFVQKWRVVQIFPLRMFMTAYHSRKTGWSKAFRNPELPKTNKGEAGNAHYSAVTHLTGLTLDLGVKCMVAEFHVYAGCRKGIENGQYKGGSGPSRAVMDAKLVKETFERISNTPLTSKASLEFVNNILKTLGLKETSETTDQETMSTNQESETEDQPITREPSVLQVHKFLEEQVQARSSANTSSPKYINTPDKAPRNGKRKIQFGDTLDDLTSSNSHKRKKNKSAGKSLDEKAMATLSEGFSVETINIGIYRIMINEEESRCYTVNLNNPSCTCPQYQELAKSRETDRNTSICKHIVVMMLCLGFTYESKILRKYSYNANDRVLLKLKMATFSHKSLNIEETRKSFEEALCPKLETELVDLPFFNPKKYFGIYDTYEEAKLFINEQKERYPCKWFALKYGEKRYVCTSAVHTVSETKKLRQKLSQARPLVFLVYFTRIYLNKNTGKYSAKDEKKYFHMKSSCVSTLGSNLLQFSNIQPPFDVDVSRLSHDNQDFVKKTFPDYTFVE